MFSSYNNLYGQACSGYTDWYQATWSSGQVVELVGTGNLYTPNYSSTTAPLTDSWSRCDHYSTCYLQWRLVGTCTSCTNRTVGSASSSPTPCINTVMTSITHSTTQVTGITSSSGLPTGVTASYSGNVITISGTPSVAGTYNYTITPTSTCGTATATGNITVRANRTVGAASSSPTPTRNTLMTSITHTTSEVTSVASSSGLPTGVSASYSGNVITISGTPTVAGNYNYTITPTSNCGSQTATGSIIVSTPVPIELLSFNAELKENYVEINWKTSTETNNDYFILEKSHDGINWIKSSEIKAVGNSNTTSHYSWVDNTHFNGQNYYRLSQVDLDGTKESFNIISVNNSTENEVVLYPNPSSDNFTLEYFSENNDELTIIIESDQGLEMYYQKFNVTKGNNHIHIFTESLMQGLYLVLIENASGVKLSKKIVKN